MSSCLEFKKRSSEVSPQDFCQSLLCSRTLEVHRGANVSMPQSKVQSTSQSGKVSASKGSSKKSTKGKSGTIPEDGEKRVVVRDEFGNDVTPRSLIQSVEKTSIKPPAGN